VATPPPDLTELLTADHRRVARLLGGGAPSRELVPELSSHLVAEAQLLYPALRRHVAAADVDGLLATDHRLEEVLTELDHSGGDSPDELGELFARHVRNQEQLFPELRRAAGGEELSRLGGALGSVVMEAPTHPHPHLPREGPLEVIADSVASTVDHLRDALRRDDHRGQ
jgi:hypothetical protein